MTREFEKNSRLTWVFSICQELGIDDPIAWMNSVSPTLLNWWISFKIYRSEKEREAYEEASGKKKETFKPEEASAYLGKLSCGKRRPNRRTVLRGDPRS